MTARVTLAEQIAEVAHQIGAMQRSFPDLVSTGVLSQALADRKLDCMRGVLATLKFIEKHEARIKLAMKGTEP